MINGTFLVAESDRGSLAPSEIDSVARGFGLGEVSRVDFVPAGLMNRNWRFETERGRFAVKCLADASGGDARNNLAVMQVLADRGLPVCTPVATLDGDSVITVGAASFCAVPWVHGRQPAGLALTLAETTSLGVTLAALHVGLGEVGSPLLPKAERQPTSRVTDPGRALDDADRFLALANRTEPRDAFDASVVEFVEQRKVLLEKYAHLRPTTDRPSGPFGWTHGDFQHLNVIWSAGEVAAVIDWDRIRVRPLGEEAARSATLLFGNGDGRLDLERVAAFVAGYRSVVDLSTDDVLDAVDRLWWKRMCDYWHLEFHYDRDDHGCDHLFLSASRFLEWWTSRLDEVRAAFTARA